MNLFTKIKINSQTFSAKQNALIKVSKILRKLIFNFSSLTTQNITFYTLKTVYYSNMKAKWRTIIISVGSKNYHYDSYQPYDNL